MKSFTTRFLRTIANLHLAFPILFLIYNAIVFDLPSKTMIRMLGTFSFWILCTVGIFTGYGLREMTRWAWYSFILSTLGTMYAECLIAIRYSQSHHMPLSLTLTLLGWIFLMFRLGREIRVPYFVPRIRWWDSNARYRLMLPVEVRREHEHLAGEILDISHGGCYVKSRYEVQVNEKIAVKLELFGETVLLVGTAVWKSQNTVTHPKGFGVKFDPLNPLQSEILKQACKLLNKINLLQNQKNTLSPEEFAEKMSHLKNQRLKLPQNRATSAS